ncbi:PREDICTED: syntenin-2 isoform X1 [Myotis brandtii]|uniref:syntenin-2 isoform X1 n=1 Tax=Myotis brandtii TaxID=109478 RepID=UPI0007046B53|nr:PREDICTED: syntenin-2 isoform X1 [Myotis brandtii]
MCAPNPPPHLDKGQSPPLGLVASVCPAQRITWACPSPRPGESADQERAPPSRSRNAAGTRATTFQGGKQTLWAVTGEGRAAAPGLQTVVSGPSPGQVVAPVSGNSLGVRRAEIKPGVREIHLCKDERGKTGLRLRAINKGLFVQLVQVNTPASLVGLRFGDQILQIDGRDCAGWSTDRAHRAVKRASAEKIVMVVRDRPFQRTVTMHRDSTGHVGFVIKKGKVVSIVKGSSAARNGLLTNHYVCEVNGQNVIGLKDKEVTEILATAGSVITLTIIPTVIYEHMVKKLSPTLLRHTMDHSVPDV